MMGLSAFEENSNPSFYCSSSIDRSLTKRLIDCSNNPLKISSSCFAHSPEWADGLDIWSSSQTSTTKPENSRRQFDFHRDLGLYLPRHEKPNSAPISSKNLHHHSTPTITQLPPERLRILIRREKDFLLQNDLSNPPVIIDHQPPLSLPPPPTNSLRLSTSVEIPSTNEVRLPLRHIPTKPKSPPPVPLPPSQPPKLNQDTLKSLLKEHLTSLLTRGASTVNAHRSVINAPSFDIRQQIRTDPKLMEERFAKLDEFIPTQQMKNNQPSPPPLIFYQRSTLGLTVTPVDLCTQRNTQMVSLEKMAQQRTIFTDSDCSSVNSSRPSTQPVPLPSSNHVHHQHQQQRAVLRKNLEITNPSPIDAITSNESSTNKLSETSQSAQNPRKAHSNPRSSSKSNAQRATVPAATTTIELLPPIISGKRLHIPLANHRYL